MKNVFVMDGRVTIAFIDTKGTISGDLMKEINSRRPEVVHEIKEYLKVKGETAKGQIVKIDNYIFLVNKIDYRNKFDYAATAHLLHQTITMYKTQEFKTYADPKLPQDIKTYMEDLGVRLYDRVDWSPKEELEVLE